MEPYTRSEGAYLVTRAVDNDGVVIAESNWEMFYQPVDEEMIWNQMLDVVAGAKFSEPADIPQDLTAAAKVLGIAKIILVNWRIDQATYEDEIIGELTP